MDRTDGMTGSTEMNTQGNDERAARVARLRDEIDGVIEREYALAARYQELAASFLALMPDAKLRHDAVLQALATTLKLGKQEVVEALGCQQEELGLLEQAVAELFAALNARGSGLPHGASAPQPPAADRHCPKCGERLARDPYENVWKCRGCSHEAAAGGPAYAAPEQQAPASSPAPAKEDLQRPCPMCGGKMHFHVHDGQWLCYTCAHEEAQAGSGPDKSDGDRERTGGAGTQPAPSFVTSLADMVHDQSPRPGAGASSYQARMAARKKTCPVCKKKMDWHGHEKLWKCFFCNHRSRY